jgi:hypothetical protein
VVVALAAALTPPWVTPAGARTDICTEEEIVSPEPQDLAYFGSGVAFYRDWAVVGAAFMDHVPTPANAGKAYFFERENGIWGEDQTVSAPSEHIGPSYFFGSSVAMDGDVAVVAAPIQLVGEVFSGAAHIYRRTSDWAHEQVIAPSDGEESQYFGGTPAGYFQGVAIADRLIVVGSPGATVGSNSGQGKAYVYIYDVAEEEWIEDEILTASDGAADDGFGASVAISGTKVIVGAPEDDHSSAANPGSAYVFKRNSNGTWTQEQKLTYSSPASHDRFGESVAIDGTTAIVGAPGRDEASDCSTEGEFAAIYGFSSSTWTLAATLQASDCTDGALFGSTVSVSGSMIIVGAREADYPSGPASSGAAYLFQRISGAWTEVNKLLPESSDAESEGYFGVVASLKGDEVIVGSIGGDVSTFDKAGAIYFFEDLPCGE